MIKLYYSNEKTNIEWEVLRENNFQKVVFLESKSIDDVEQKIFQQSFFTIPCINIINAKVFDVKKQESFDLLKNLNKDKNVHYIYSDAKGFSTPDFATKFKTGKIQSKRIYACNNVYISEIVLDFLDKANVKISDEALSYFVNNAANNYQHIMNETKKIIAFGKSDIGLEDIKSIIFYHIENDAFKLIDFIIQNNKVEFVKLLNSLYNKNSDVVQLLAIIARQFFSLKIYLLIRRSGVNQFDASKALNLKPFQQQIYEKRINIINIEKVNLILYNLYNLDIGYKTGKLDVKSKLIQMFL